MNLDEFVTVASLILCAIFGLLHFWLDRRGIR